MNNVLEALKAIRSLSHGGNSDIYQIASMTVERLERAKESAVSLWNDCGEQLQKADDVLRNISSYLGQGGMHDTENLDYEEVEARIREGINHHTHVLEKMLSDAREEAARQKQRADGLETEVVVLRAREQEVLRQLNKEGP